jgi:hypothetical protein
MKKSKSKFINNISLRQVNRGTKQIESAMIRDPGRLLLALVARIRVRQIFRSRPSILA